MLVVKMHTVKCFGRFPSLCEDSELDGFLSFKHRLLFPKMVQGLVNCIYPSKSDCKQIQSLFSINCSKIIFQILFKNLLFGKLSKHHYFVLNTNFSITNTCSGIDKDHQKWKLLPFIFLLSNFQQSCINESCGKNRWRKETPYTLNRVNDVVNYWVCAHKPTP